MNVVTRHIAAIPVRSSTAAWIAIADMLASPGSDARLRLDSVTGIAGILITSEYTRQAPIVVIPTTGARVRIRTVHGDDAPGVLADEIPLAIRPCDEPGWTLSLPCGIDDIDEMRAAVASLSGIEVRDVTEGITVAVGELAMTELSIDFDELERP